MAKAFGKIKRLIRKAPNDENVQKEEGSSSTPVTLTKTEEPTDGTTELVGGSEKDTSATVAIVEKKTEEGDNDAKATDNVPPSTSLTDADDVLDGILQDLNIKVGQLAVNANQSSDAVSEYSGGSAKSVESSDDSEEEDDDDDNGEAKESKDKASSKKKKNTPKSVGDRVAIVVAAAEEIRKQRGSPATITTDPASTEGASTSSNPAAVSVEPAVTSSTETMEPVGVKKSSIASGKKSLIMTAAIGAVNMTRKSPITTELSKQARDVARKSPIVTLLPKNSKNKSTSRSTSPQFSPPVNGSDAVDPGAVTTDNIKSLSLSSKNDTDKEDVEVSNTKDNMKSLSLSSKNDTDKEDVEVSNIKDNMKSLSLSSKNDTDKEDVEVSNIKDTSEVSDDGGEGSTSFEEGTLDDTLGTDGDPTLSIEGDSTLFDDDASLEITKGGVKTRKTVMNKDIIIHQPGGESSLVVRAMYYTPLPATPEDIIIKVEASTVSFRDCLLRQGIGMDKATFPFIPGCEVVGTISNIGKSARNEGYRVGDRVVGMSRTGGGNAYYAKLNFKNVAPIISTKIDAADAVCLVNVYMTAYQALRVGKKDGTPLTEANVLITDGWSPIGQAAVALAKLEGANVYVTTSDSRHDEYLKTLGVKCLPLAPSKWLYKLKGKMDIVIDNTCFDTYESSWKALNPNGVLVCTGMTSIYSFEHSTGGGCGGCEALGDFRDYHAKWASIKARYMMSQTKFHDLSESFQADPKKYQQELKYLCFLVENGTLKPNIAERVNIEEVPDAQRYLETGKANGTIVCLP